jgi:hypothetical protein
MLTGADWRVTHSPIIIVAGFLRCGMATMMAMLEAGGVPIAGGALPPSYELPQTAHKIEDFIRGIAGPYGVADAMLAQIPQPMLELGGAAYPAWFDSLHGQAVKFVSPHLMPHIPRGANRVIWMDRDEQERARSLLRYVGAPVIDFHADIFAAYFTACRPAARERLRRAGATILDVQHADIVGGPERCRAAVDRIADFIGLPIDREAMARRVEVTRL